MPEKKNTATEVLTGSTGNAGTDSSIRGFVAGVLTFGIGVAEVRLDLLTDTELITLLALVASGTYVAAGQWDRRRNHRLK